MKCMQNLLLADLVLWWSESDLSGLDTGPLELLNVDRDQVKRGKNNDGLQTQLLSFIVVWFGGPVQEGGDVLGHLGGGGWGTIFVLNQVVKQDSTHGNGTTWEVWVVVGAWWQDNTSWRLVWVTGQKGKDVVTGTVSGLDD
ncbi:hypothetical protein WICPIJ_009033 [Wickerhamomyces pijperi]|uniref:Uncharacterized protein n=1 Tax=Wickerhamomyces pijperi TaxID=599730 RepID=A0A9P8TFS0_WICPI|nr:hypothetical protein WICPIJ_009033 [Wickerhamomyces pijperi]